MKLITGLLPNEDYSLQDCRDLYHFLNTTPELRNCTDPAHLAKLGRLVSNLSPFLGTKTDDPKDEGELMKKFKKKLDSVYSDIAKAHQRIDLCDKQGFGDIVRNEQYWKEASKTKSEQQRSTSEQ